MFKKLFKSKTLAERIKAHPKYKETYKIQGLIINGKQTFEYQGHTLERQRAVIRLVYDMGGEEQYVTMWESEEYRDFKDAQNVLMAELKRLSEEVPRHFTVVDFNGNKYREIPINTHDRRYLLNRTNL